MHRHSDEIRITELPDHGAQIVVPPAGFWRTSKGPFFRSAFWLAFSAACTVAAAGGAATGVKMPAMGISWLAFPAALALCWAFGLRMLYMALGMAYSRTVLSLREGIVTMTYTDFLSTSQEHWRRTDIEEIRVSATGGLPDLQIRFRGGQRFGMLGGRDEGELHRVADALRRALKEAARREPSPSPDVMEQPAVSRAILERSANGFTLKIPALGFRGKVPWMAAGAALVGLAASVGAWSLWARLEGPWSASAWWGFGLLAVAALFAFAVALEAVAFAFRRRVLTVEGAVLTERHTTWWGGVRRRQWRRSDLTAIDVGPPNPARAFAVLPHLQLHRRDGRPKRLMGYHDEQELLWIATLLRQALRLPASSDKS